MRLAWIASAMALGVATAHAAPPKVHVSFFPLHWMARELAGESIELHLVTPVEEDPATYLPSDLQVEELQKADLILVNGAGFEPWVDVLTLPEDRVVDTTRALKGRLLTLDSVTHSHGPGGEHSHSGPDGHTWLSPKNASAQLDAVAVALSKLLPERAKDIEARRATLSRRLEGLAPRIQRVTQALAGRRLFAAHPAYNYLARDAGWTVKSFGFEPDEPLSKAQLDEVAAALREEPPAALILWEGDPLEANKAALNSLGLLSVTYSPCEQVAELGTADFVALMDANLSRLEATLAEQAAARGAAERAATQKASTQPGH